MMHCDGMREVRAHIMKHQLTPTLITTIRKSEKYLQKKSALAKTTLFNFIFCSCWHSSYSS